MEDKKDKYKDETVSFSGLTRLAFSPSYYRKYKDKQLDEDFDNASMALGRAIHCLVFEPDRFEKEFVVENSDLQKPSGMMLKFVEAYVDRVRQGIVKVLGYSEEEEILQFDHNNESHVELAMASAYVRAGFKLPMDRVIKDFQKEEVQAYLRFLLESGGKQMITSYEYFIATRCRDSIANHKVAGELLMGNVLGLEDTYSELDLSWKFPGYDFNMRSVIDRLVINHESKEVIIVDLKTTGKSVFNFKSSYKFYKYYMQLAIYKEAVVQYLRDRGIEGYKISVYVVAVQTTGINQCVVYRPEDKDLVEGRVEFVELLNRLRWHCDNDLWEHPREYYEGDGIVSVSLDEGEGNEV